jgi:hypothetical protein
MKERQQMQERSSVRLDTANTTPETAHAAIARRAHELFVARGGGPGRDQEDWYRAKEELARAQRPS